MRPNIRLYLALAFLLAAGTAAGGVELTPDAVLIGADADALGRTMTRGDLNGDGRDDFFISGCGP